MVLLTIISFYLLLSDIFADFQQMDSQTSTSVLMATPQPATYTSLNSSSYLRSIKTYTPKSVGSASEKTRSFFRQQLPTELPTKLDDEPDLIERSAEYKVKFIF